MYSLSFRCLPSDKPTASSKSKFSTERDLVFPVSVSGILSFPYGDPVSAYVLFFVFSSLLSFPSTACSRRQFLHKNMYKVIPELYKSSARPTLHGKHSTKCETVGQIQDKQF